MTAPSGRAGNGTSTRQPDRGADQQARRVAIVHHQTRPTLAVAAAFTFAAGVAAVVPHHTGHWLKVGMGGSGGA